MKKIAIILALFTVINLAFAQGPSFPYSVQFTWTASTTAGVTGQNIYRAPYSGSCGTYVLLTTTQLPATATTYTDSTVTPGAQYCYGITALVGTAESGLDLNSNNPVSLPPAPQTNFSSAIK